VNIIEFPHTAAFFLSLERRCLPGLTDLVIQAAAMAQRVEIEEALLCIKLKQKCFVALMRAQVNSETISPSGLPTGSVGFKSDAPSANLTCLRSTTPEDEIIRVGQAAGISSWTESSPIVSAKEHNAFPKGRW
jgi:hypothetical protein